MYAQAVAHPAQPRSLATRWSLSSVHGGRPRGPIAWLLRDTHQAIIVSSPTGDRVFMDFMTEGGAAHPVHDSSVAMALVRVVVLLLVSGSVLGYVRCHKSKAVP